MASLTSILWDRRTFIHVHRVGWKYGDFRAHTSLCCMINGEKTTYYIVTVDRVALEEFAATQALLYKWLLWCIILHVCLLLYFYSGLTFWKCTRWKLYAIRPNDSHSQPSASSKRVRVLSDEEGNHCSQKFKIAMNRSCWQQRCQSIKDSLNEVMSLSEKTKLPIAIYTYHILRTPFNASYVLQYQ